MNVLYGVVGEGMGHATRSQVAVDHLVMRGHRVLVAASGRAYDLFAREGYDAVQIGGLFMVHDDGAVNWTRSALANVAALRETLPKNAAATMRADAFAPHVAFSDFDSFAYLYAKARGLPVFSVDNMHVMARCLHDPDLIAHDPMGFSWSKKLVEIKLPNCDHYVITSFFALPLASESIGTTTIVPPIVRGAVVAAHPSWETHALVYTHGETAEDTMRAMQAVPQQPFVVYGAARSGRFGNCLCKPFSADEFVRDLASSRAVVANAGMSLMGEAVYLGKPMYAVPVQNQFEQTVNAWYLAKLGYGEMHEAFEPRLIGKFLEAAPAYAAKLRSSRRQDGNQEFYRVLDRLVGSR